MIQYDKIRAGIEIEIAVILVTYATCITLTTDILLLHRTHNCSHWGPQCGIQIRLTQDKTT